MKKAILLSALALLGRAAFAQTLELPVNGAGATRTRMTMSGAESNKIFAAMKKIPGVFDEQGKQLDSAEAVKLTKTFEYQIGYRMLNKDGIYRKVLSKINLTEQAKADLDTKKLFAPKIAALQEGALLDIKPFGSRIPEGKVNGKGIILIFWYPGCTGRPDGFADVNEVIGNYINKGNFEVFAVTRYSDNDAINALKTTPILNARHFFNAGDLFDIYSPDNKNMIIVTDKEHRITYSMLNNASMTPRELNRLLKAL